jgi:hypothetical protein
LEVRPPGQPIFPIEKNLIMRRPAFEQLHNGLVLEVKHWGDPEGVIPTAPLKVLEH